MKARNHQVTHAPKAAATQSLTMDDWSNEPRPVKRTFPGPRNTGVPVRVATERQAFADVIAHAKESLNAEICGVLVGLVCEDDEGLFLHVQAAIRGSAAREGNVHVTFTQETWNAVHQTMEQQYPKLRMIGWYHSHPGFGVEFSEMDVFIQRNFFPSPTQIALVTDPLGGDTAICHNATEGIRYLERFWVDGRSHTLRVPAPTPATAAPHSGAADLASTADDSRNTQARLSQLIQVVDDLRTSYHRFLTAVFMLACVGLTCGIGYTIYSNYVSRQEPPRLNTYMQIPVKIGDKTVLLGVAVVDWTVPPELNAVYIEMEKQKQAALAKQPGTEIKEEPPKSEAAPEKPAPATPPKP